MTKVIINFTKWLTITLVSLLLIILLALVVLLHTNLGLSAVLWGVEKAVPQLQVESGDGAIFPSFRLNKVSFTDDDLNINTYAEHLTLAVNAGCLLEATICINELSADGLTFSMPTLPESEPNPEPAESEPLTSISTPVPILLGRLSLSNIDLDILGNKISWKTFTSGASFKGNRLRLRKTTWEDIILALAPSEAKSGVKQQSGAKPQSGTQPKPEQESETSSGAGGTVNGENRPIVLPAILIPLDVDIARFDINRFKLEQETPVVVHHLGLKAKAKQHSVTIETLEVDMPEASATLATQISLAGDYPLSLSLDAEVKDPIASGQTLQLAANGSVAQLEFESTLAGRAEAKIKGKVEPLDPTLPFDIQLLEGKAQWPLVEKGDYFVDIASFKTRGSLDSYTVNLDTKIKGKDLPDVSVNLEGQGDLEQINLESLKVDTLGGSIAGKLMANWVAPINWSAELNVQHLQPGLQWTQAEGDISGDINTTGSLTPQGGWQVDVPMLDIDGLLRSYPLKIKGAISASDVKGAGALSVSTPSLALSHGPNSLLVKGKLDKQWDMSVVVNLLELKKSVPDLSGTIVGDVELKGQFEEPKIAIDLSANSIAWNNEATLQQLTLVGNVQPLPVPKANIHLNAINATYQEQVIDSVNLVLSGTEQAHNLTLDVISNIVSTSLALSGQLQQDPDLKWNGELQRVDLRSEQGKWALNQPTQLGFNGATQLATISAHCWLQADSSLCLKDDISVGEAGSAALSIEGFNFAQIAMFVPEPIKLDGALNANVSVAWAPELPPKLDAYLELPKGQISQTGEQSLHVGWDMVRVNAKLDNNALKADWLIDIVDNGDVSGNVSIPDVLIEQKEMEGELKLSTFSLAFLSPLVGEYSQLGANISTDLKFNGPMLHPKVDGQFAIEDILLKGNVSPIDINDGQFVIDFKGYQANLNANIETPEGALKVDGDADWQDMSAWQSNARVFAEQLIVDIPPMIKVKVVPDMTIALTPQAAKIKGDIALPWGRILVEELPPSAISVSKDQVILDASLQPVESSTSVPFAVETDINISIGDDFRLSAFGLEGDLVGKLNVAQNEKGPLINGEINIVDGSYRSFGQDLLIEEGKILMNGPVDQPYVAITAVRNPDNTADDVTAGVKVTGPADEPTVTIFSDPAMPQANALSYLLRGQDIDGESGGNAMTTTLIGLSLAKSGKVVGELGEAFGVQDLQLDTAGSGDDSQVTVSGYILPGLQVKYGVGIFEPVGEFTIRYRLLTDLYVEAVSGLDSAVDLLYQFEFE